MDEVRIYPETLAGDPFAFAGERLHGCYEGIVYIGHLIADKETGEEVELVDAVPCRRCKAAPEAS